jgi:hypothetical protein
VYIPSAGKITACFRPELVPDSKNSLKFILQTKEH